MVFSPTGGLHALKCYKYTIISRLSSVFAYFRIHSFHCMLMVPDYHRAMSNYTLIIVRNCMY